MNKPPTVLIANIQKLDAKHSRKSNEISKYLVEMLERFPSMKEEYDYPGIEHNQLFEVTYNHNGGNTLSTVRLERSCRACSA